jgi:hypothetical protein
MVTTYSHPLSFYSWTIHHFQYSFITDHTPTPPRRRRKRCGLGQHHGGTLKQMPTSFWAHTVTVSPHETIPKCLNVSIATLIRDFITLIVNFNPDNSQALLKPLPLASGYGKYDMMVADPELCFGRRLDEFSVLNASAAKVPSKLDVLSNTTIVRVVLRHFAC